MLISSHRHTAADLQYWRQCQAADECCALNDKPKSALLSARKFNGDYIATSWGKDSVVVSHLCLPLRLPLVHIRMEGPQRDPDQDAVRDAFLRKYPRCDYHEIVVTCDNSQQSDSQHAPALDRGIQIAAERFGRKWIGGLRAEESGVRKISARCHGMNTAHSSRPLLWWPCSAIWGYLAQHELPVHPAYAMTAGGRWNRDQIRVSIIGGAKGRQFGRLEWEQEYYGDVLRRIEAASSTSRT